MHQLFQKALEALPGGAVGGLVGGVLAFLYWDDKRQAACTQNLQACLDASDTRTQMVILFAMLGALAGAAVVAGYRVYQRVEKGESIADALVKEEPPGQ